jgi:hypothetical protein
MHGEKVVHEIKIVTTVILSPKVAPFYEKHMPVTPEEAHVDADASLELDAQIAIVRSIQKAADEARGRRDLALADRLTALAHDAAKHYDLENAGRKAGRGVK